MKKFDLTAVQLYIVFHLNFFMVDSVDNNFCCKFSDFTMNLFHLFGFTKALVFGVSASVTRLNLFFVRFIDGSRFFKELSERVSRF